MDAARSQRETNDTALRQLRRRAETIVRTRPAYAEIVAFYLPVFCRQIEWRDRVVAHPEPLSQEEVFECLGRGTALIERFDPGFDSRSMFDLWTEMKAVFSHGNKVLSDAMNKIETAEQRSVIAPAAWLLEQRPDRGELVVEASETIGVEETVLATLARAVTFPHWSVVASSWLRNGPAERWRRFRCPVCGGPPGLAETRTEQSACDGVTGSNRRWLHCPFCGCRWPVPSLQCPSCASVRPGAARYLFTREEPELRIDYCNSCRRYLKTIDGDKIAGPVHVGLEQLTTAHLDLMAKEKDLHPLAIAEDHGIGRRYS